MLALLMISFLLIFFLRTELKSESTKWLIAIVFFTFIAAFSVSWEVDILPFFSKLTKISKETQSKFMIVNTLCTSIPQYYLPYLFVMYSISFMEKSIHYSKKILLNMCLLIAPTASLIFLPLKPNSLRTFEESTNYFKILSFWSIPYLLLGGAIIFYSTVTETNPRIKFYKKLTLYITFLLIPNIIINYFILRTSGLLNAWSYSIPVTIIILTVFIMLTVKYGFLSVRIKFKKLSTENMIQKIAKGSEMLNHTLKNEIGKMRLANLNIKYSVNKTTPDIDDINDNILIIEYSIGHLEKFIKYNRNFTKDMGFVQSVNSLNHLILQAIKNTESYGKNNITNVNFLPFSEIKIKCDGVQIVEVLANIIKNAYEATNKKGIIRIWYELSKNSLSIFIEDTGCGIKSSDFPHIFEPYFSTKDKNVNFGIGLSFCYLALKKHHGNIKIFSEEGKGTTVQLVFPQKCVVKENNHHKKTDHSIKEEKNDNEKD